ncbi:MAG: CoA-binding protein [Ferruginibacter sp.]
MDNKTTLVIGASENPDRYSNRAIKSLVRHNQQVKAIGLRNGSVEGVQITKDHEEFKDIDTVTLYLNNKNQKQYEEYILSLKPKRIIFNPGAENEDFAIRANEKGIKTLEACTLVMLSTGQY